MVDKRTRATEEIFAHVDRARDMILDFRNDSITAEGALKDPQRRRAVLKAAREDLTKAIEILQITPWSH